MENLHHASKNPKTKATVSYPVYTRPGTYQASGYNHIRIYPINDWTETDDTPHFSILNIEVDYIRKPIDPKWGYVVVNNKALYNANESVNFELHASEESSLTNKILELAGIVINKPGLSEVAIRSQQLNENNKNQ